MNYFAASIIITIKEDDSDRVYMCHDTYKKVLGVY